MVHGATAVWYSVVLMYVYIYVLIKLEFHVVYSFIII